MTENQIKTNIPTPENWEKSVNVYSGDDLIDAYIRGREKGREDGKSEAFQVLFSQFTNNMEQAKAESEKLYSIALKSGVKFQSIHIKADSITKFSVLFIADKNDFISDNFRSIYIYARQVKKEAEKENFYISFSFMPSIENLNENCLTSDGYFMKYEKK